MQWVSMTEAMLPEPGWLLTLYSDTVFWLLRYSCRFMWKLKELESAGFWLRYLKIKAKWLKLRPYSKSFRYISSLHILTLWNDGHYPVALLLSLRDFHL